MGKKRHTAKTGDKGLYKSREAAAVADEAKNKDNDDSDNKDDRMYNEVDRFHNVKDRDFLKLDDPNSNGHADDSDDADDSDEDRVEAVMDLGFGSGNDDDDDDSEASSDSTDEGSVLDDDDDDDDSEEDGEAAPLSASDDDDDDENDEMEENVRDWGRKKSAYYHGDTADLEIGQDEDDAFLEEEAAKEVQAARFKDMTEDDFVLSDDDDEDDDIDVQGATTTTTQGRDVLASSSRDLSKLSKKDKQRLLDKQHPELFPLLSHFSTMVEDLHTKTLVATKAVFFGEEGTADSIGATKMGQQYLLTKALLQSSAALNLAMYLLLKAEQAADAAAANNDTTVAVSVDPAVIQSHPVMLHLQKINSLTQNLEDGVEEKATGLKEQLENLVKAASLMLDAPDDDGVTSDDGSDVDGSDESEASADDDENYKTQNVEGLKRKGTMNVNNKNDGSASSTAEQDDESSEEDEATTRRKVLTEARFGLRPKEVAAAKDDMANARKRRRPVISDAGDDDMEETQQKTISQSLATTLNSIEQRSETRKRRSAPLAEHLDEHDEDDGELRRGLEMMEAELGKGSDEEDGKPYNGRDDPEFDDDDDVAGGDFYAQVSKKSKARKEVRNSLYSVAPKFPRVEGVIEGERAISQMILKNRGLVPHKAKINRNPRVKKREQYRKAIIRRKGAVRDVRTDEGHKYGGEETGIKSGLSRSRKLAR